MGKILTATAQEPPLFTSYLPSSQVRKPKGTHPVSGIHVYLPTPSIPFHCSILPQMAKFYFPLPAPPNYSEGAWPIWLEGSIYLPVSKCLPRAADTRPRFLRHWPPNSLCGDPLSVPLSFQTVCPRLCTLHRGRGIPGSWEGRRALGPWLGAGNRGLRRQPAVPSGLWCLDKHSIS